MEKSVKLQRYDRKDYTELVEFPVEIVGRDGVVRRYSFEDSIRLYQRRITFAHVRYRDPDLAHAEVNHCRSRIDQLRRSYFHRYGWGTPEGQRSAEQNFGDLAGELAAFICRVLGVEGRPGIRFEPVWDDEAGTTTWYLQVEKGLEQSQSGMLLYVHRFAADGADAVRDRFFAFLKGLGAHGARSGDAERLIAFHHTADCGFVLTGRAGDFESFATPSPAPTEEVSGPVDLGPAPWDHALELIRKGDHEAALRRTRDILRDQPWHRSAYVGGAMLACYLGDPLVGEEIAEVGSRYFPHDASIQYYLGLCRARLGRRGDAERALTKALELAPDLATARGTLATEHLQRGRYFEALRVLRGRRGVTPDDRRVDGDLRLLENAATWPLWGRLAFATALPAGIVLAVALQHVLPLLIIGVGLAAERTSQLLFQRQLGAFTSRRRLEEIAQGLRQIHRRSRLPEGIS